MCVQRQGTDAGRVVCPQGRCAASILDTESFLVVLGWTQHVSEGFVTPTPPRSRFSSTKGSLGLFPRILAVGKVQNLGRGRERTDSGHSATSALAGSRGRTLAPGRVAPRGCHRTVDLVPKIRSGRGTSAPALTARCCWRCRDPPAGEAGRSLRHPEALISRLKSTTR